MMAIADLIGSSARFRAVLDDVHVVAGADCSVLIQGETGTGKEVIAHAIHDSSPRQRGPFVGLNCAAIPAPLLESELFGHEKGAFTGAIAQTMGRFQAAHGGTLFLDEIGDLPLEPRFVALTDGQRVPVMANPSTDERVVRGKSKNAPDMGFVPGIGLMFGGLFVAPLADRIGRRPILLACVALFGSVEVTLCIQPFSER